MSDCPPYVMSLCGMSKKLICYIPVLYFQLLHELLQNVTFVKCQLQGILFEKLIIMSYVDTVFQIFQGAFH